MVAEKGFFQTLGRRKLISRDRMRRNNNNVGQRNIMALSLVVVFGIVTFVAYNLSCWQSIRSYNTGSSNVAAAAAGGGGASDIRNGASNNIRGSHAWISQSSQPFNENGQASNAKHLIVVAGHSVTISGHLEDAGVDESDWFLLDYQKNQGLPQAIQAHIKAGISEAEKDPHSLLIFSGGETRAVTGPTTEGQAYFHVADAMHLWPINGSVRARTTTEEFATDSFENFMFSICRFHEVTGKYPQRITIVSFSFKRRRFETLHAPALRWPSEAFEYVGVDPPPSSGFNLDRATEGEVQNAAAPFENDPYGCHSPVLQQKRKERNPFSRTPPYPLSCPEMKDLLSFCGPELYPADRVPWTSSTL